MPTYNNAINTASLGTGFVYSDGSGLLGISTPGGLNFTVTKFTANGTFTKNVATKFIDVICWNGGGGGGSGRQGASGAASGGSGGAGGGVLVFSGMASYFNASESVTIGAGGTGGAAQASASTNGNDGTPGGVSALGNIFISLAGSGSTGFNNGAKGTSTGNVSGGAQGNYMYPYYPIDGSTGALSIGGVGKIIAGTTPKPVTDYSSTATTFAVYYIPQSGGGGAGANSVTAYQGGTGGDSIAFLTQTGFAVPDILNAGGAGGIESGTIDGGNGNDAITSSGGRYVPASGGGAGGGQSAGLVAGNGGNGGAPGAGAGGGGGSLNGTNSGAGGAGGRGEVWVIEYY